MTERQPILPTDTDFSRRGFLRGAVLAGGGLAAATIAACAPGAGASPAWTYGPPPPAPTPRPDATGAPASPGASMSHGPAASGAAASPGTDEHDAAALAVVKRFLDGEGTALEGQGNLPLEPRLDGDTKVFELTIDTIKHRIDAEKDPIDALGFNGT